MGQYVEIVGTLTLRDLFGAVGQRNPNLRRLTPGETRMRKLKVRRHHTDHRVGLIIERYGPVDNSPVTSEAPLPEPITKHCQTIAIHLLLSFPEYPAFGRPPFQYWEKVRCNKSSTNAFWFRTRGHIETMIRICSYGVEGLTLL